MRNSSDDENDIRELLKSTIESLKKEISRLGRQQNDMLASAVYVEMDDAQTKEYDERHKRIQELFEHLNQLRKG